MENNYEKNEHSIGKIMMHLEWCAKYRYKMFGKFEYKNGKKARFFFVVKSKKELTRKGPQLNKKENVARFRKKHKNTFIKSGRVYAREMVDFNLKEFLENWKKKNKDRMREMSINEMTIAG